MLAWVLGQALVNIGAVLGLLPIIGVPLPLVSYGGSALVTTLVALGMLHRRSPGDDPGAAEALAARPSVVRRSLGGPTGAAEPGVAGEPEPLAAMRHVVGGARRRRHGRPRRARARPRRLRCASSTRTSASPRSAPRRASRPGWCPAPGYDLGWCPGCRCRAGPAPTSAAAAAPARRRRGGRARWGRARADVRRRLRRLRLHPRLPRGPPARPADRRARGRTPGRAWPTGWAPGSPARRHHLPGHPAARRRVRRHAAAPRDHDAGPRRAARRGAGAFGLEPDLPTLLVFGGSQGAQRLNVTFGRRRAALAAAGVQVLHVTGRGKAVERRAGRPRRRPYVCRRYVDRMDLAYAAADLVVCRAGAETCLRADRRGAARGVRAAPDRQRRAAPQRRARGRGRRRPDRRRRRPDARSGCATCCSRCSPTPPRSPRWPRPRPPSGSTDARRAARRPGADGRQAAGGGPAERRSTS